MLRRRPAPLVSPARAAVFGLLLALLVAPFVIPIIPGGQSLNEGNTAPRTLVAAHGAQYQSAALTTVAQDEAARTVADVPLPVDPLIRQQQTDKLDNCSTPFGPFDRRTRPISSDSSTLATSRLPLPCHLSAGPSSSTLTAPRLTTCRFVQTKRYSTSSSGRFSKTRS